ncbi:MAG: Cd(II)/Pb(II)-responsive transcriptional regulator [Burkholderiales bacterium]
MKIGELAKATGCEVETIRYYEREGLLAAPPRSEAGYRQYAQREVEQLNFVRHCRSLDMPLADIKRLAAFANDAVASCDEVDTLVDDHIERVRAKLVSLNALEAQLLRLRAQCASAKPGDACRIVASLQQAAHDEACACHTAAA